MLAALDVDTYRTLLRDEIAALLDEREPPTVTGPEPLLDRAGAARYLAVSLAQLDLLSRREDDPIPYCRVGDARRYERDELRAWARRQRGGVR